MTRVGHAALLALLIGVFPANATDLEKSTVRNSFVDRVPSPTER
jgi:hypothetical protein